MSYVEITPSDLLPCPEAATWTNDGWAAFRARRLVRLGDPRAKRSFVRRELVETPEQRYARLYDTIYLEPIGPRRQPRHASKRRIDGRAKIILQNCADAYGLPADEVLGGSRKLNVVQCRHQVCWELRKHTHLSLSGIGNFLGRDHTTVLHGIRQHQARLDAGSPP